MGEPATLSAADLATAGTFAEYVWKLIAEDEFTSIPQAWRAFLEGSPLAERYSTHAETAAWLLAGAVGELRDDLAKLKHELSHERDLTEARRIVRSVIRDMDREEATAKLQRESACVNEMGGVIAHLVGVLAEVKRATTIENARTFAEIAVTNIEAWHADVWKPGPSDDAADWKPGHHREERHG